MLLIINIITENKQTRKLLLYILFMKILFKNEKIDIYYQLVIKSIIPKLNKNAIHMPLFKLLEITRTYSNFISK